MTFIKFSSAIPTVDPFTIKSTVLKKDPIPISTSLLNRPPPPTQTDTEKTRNKRLFSLIQSHLVIPTNSTSDITTEHAAKIKATEIKRKEIEERLAAKLKAEKELLQAELEKEHQERLIQRQEANKKYMNDTMEEAKEASKSRQLLYNKFLKTITCSPPLYYLPTILTKEQQDQIQ